MIKLLDRLRKRVVQTYHIAFFIIDYYNNQPGKHLLYLDLSEKAEKFSKKNKTSFWSEYQNQKNIFFKEELLLKLRLAYMEMRTPSLTLGNRQDDYRIATNPYTNQPIFSLDDYCRNQLRQQKVLYIDKTSPKDLSFHLGILCDNLLNNRIQTV